MAKLEFYGVRGAAAEWLTDYLSERAQFVEINFDGRGKKTSHLLPMTLGLPQGAILSPILFSLFIADIVKFLKGFDIVNYADDTTVLVSSDRETLNEKTNAAFADLSQWFSGNKLFLNSEKNVLY